MKKRLLIISSLSFLIVSIYIYFDITYLNVENYVIKYIDIENEKIPSCFDDTSLIFFSDLEYGNFFNEERLNKFIDEINTLQADYIVFGGDLFDTNYLITDNDILTLTTKLQSIKAKKGKFAILGDFDLESKHLESVKSILFDADFELLDENPIQLHNNSSDYMHLIGFNYRETNTDISNYYSLSNTANYTISIIHGAQLADSLIKGYSDLTLSGHSHHAQITFIKPYKTYKMTSDYTIGLQDNSNTLLYVTSGVGTTNKNIRLFSQAEIVCFRFHSQ